MGDPKPTTDGDKRNQKIDEKEEPKTNKRPIQVHCKIRGGGPEGTEKTMAERICETDELKVWRKGPE